jgi:hypothetical protein
MDISFSSFPSMAALIIILMNNCRHERRKGKEDGTSWHSSLLFIRLCHELSVPSSDNLSPAGSS